MISALVIIVVILLLFGMLPVWPYSRKWGYFPSTAPGLALLIMFILLLFGFV